MTNKRDKRLSAAEQEQLELREQVLNKKWGADPHKCTTSCNPVPETYGPVSLQSVPATSEATVEYELKLVTGTDRVNGLSSDDVINELTVAQNCTNPTCQNRIKALEDQLKAMIRMCSLQSDKIKDLEKQIGG